MFETLELSHENRRKICPTNALLSSNHNMSALLFLEGAELMYGSQVLGGR
jgi:hypothetical protein